MTKCVVVIDVQSGFKSLCDDGYIYKMNMALKEYVGRGYSFLYTIDKHEDSCDFRYTQEYKQYGLHCICDEDLIPLLDMCAKQPDSAIYKDSFTSLYLPSMLTSYEEIVIFGIASEVCVVCNALNLRACFPELPMYVREDLCRGFTQEGHDSAMNVMRACSINVVNPVN